MPTEPDGQLKGGVARYLAQTFRATEELNRATLLQLVEPRPGGRLLDCGCGDGTFTARLADIARVGQAHGIEAVGTRARQAEGRGVVVTISDLNRILPYAAGTFDVVHANQLFEHLRCSDLFLRELRRILRREGYVLLSTNNLASWHNVISLVLGMQPPPMHVSGEIVLGNRFDPFRGHRFGAHEDSHLRVFSYLGLKELCVHHGFRLEKLVSVGYYPFKPSIAKWLSALDPRHGVFLVAKVRVE